MLKPHDRTKTGIIIEFKLVDQEKNETPDEALERAMQQIEDKQYIAELEGSGIREILKIAVVFRGKELWIDHSRSDRRHCHG